MKNKPHDFVILLTGSVTPNSQTNLSIKDPKIRKKQYIDAIDFYLYKTDLKIVFAENSGVSFEEFPDFPERIEYLTYDSTPTIPDRGIGYKEMEIMDYAFRNSNFLKEAKSVAKITGRLEVLNINTLSKKFLKHLGNKSKLIYANPFQQRNMDSRCFFFTSDFWPYLKEKGKNINHQYIFEFSLWDAISQYQRLPNNNYIPIEIPLRIKGVSGSFGIQYKHNLLYHFARFIRNFSLRAFGKTSKVE